jgi:hypothetical protein
MTTSNERPTPRTRPRPAADEGQDPVVPASADRTPPAGAQTAPATGRRGAEPTVQLNVRVSGDVNDIIDAAVVASGSTKRQLIEQAIRATYANKSS